MKKASEGDCLVKSKNIIYVFYLKESKVIVLNNKYLI